MIALEALWRVEGARFALRRSSRYAGLFDSDENGLPPRAPARVTEAGEPEQHHGPGRGLGDGLHGNGRGIPHEAAAAAAAGEARSTSAIFPDSANDDVQFGSFGQINLAADGGAMTAYVAEVVRSALGADRGHEVEGRLQNGV